MLAVLAAGCTPVSHRLPRFRDWPSEAARVEREAALACARARGSRATLPPHPFTSDGCSLWPDGDWLDCCVAHDVEYWCGGDGAERRAADGRLRQCLAEAHQETLAVLMYLGARLAGAAWLPLPWRWGYGWDWPQPSTGAR